MPTVSKSEERAKLNAKGHIPSTGTICEITPPKGYKVAILVIMGTTQNSGDSIKLQTLQSESWVDEVPAVYLLANGHLYFTYPSWVPEQDVGDGTTATVRLLAEGTGEFSGNVLYHLEAS